MKAIFQGRYGSADTLELRDLDDPACGDDQVLIRVRAGGCGPDVWHIMTGKPYLARLSIGLRRPKWPIPGWDVSGTIEAVGSAVTGFAVGDEVMGTVEGSFAELAVADPDKLVPKPSSLTFEEAAALPISGVTAIQALRDVGELRSGQDVLVIGAAGGVGSLTVQIAKAMGARVTGVCSTSKVELVTSIGADDVIDYTSADFADGTRRWDLIVDTAGRRPAGRIRRALQPKGTLVIIGGDGGGNWTGGFFRGLLRAPLLSLFVSQKLRGLNAKQNAADMIALNKLVAAGTVKPVIDRTYPLAEAPAAIRYLEQGHAAGKIVVSI